ncbi:hypothetical protein [Paenibacillus sp. MMS18-CY102]|uniref:hypothetical protein n=1 Tax=Paenibacillus sp. MMS18-CY102 TaxID=2682849 RepID=UPI001365A8B0|nr:hypothetical protein [Paenibacillus sp. MMS18-CY102]MWC29338.1 hypothetical protein [Paenibacillus sp. MMS18-CY102]
MSHRWAAAFLLFASLFDLIILTYPRKEESSMAAEHGWMYVAANAVFMLLSLFVLGLALTLYHLSARLFRLAMGVLLSIISCITLWLAWLPADALLAIIVRVVWMAIVIGGTMLLWWPVARSLMRQQKRDETAWLATIWLMGPMLPLQLGLLLRLSGTALTGIYDDLYSIVGVITACMFGFERFIKPARRRKRKAVG